jgi:nucleoside phosphorylase
VAWEGAGGARAARFQKLPFLEIRAVTDMVGAAATLADFERNLSPAMTNLAEVLRRLS